ncbi:MAG: DsbA family protein [Candidatus Vogelbacteria bacterium]|nr:DsbA family protein [Candidatus Vogelbacteria bacterium]
MKNTIIWVLFLVVVVGVVVGIIYSAKKGNPDVKDTVYDIQVSEEDQVKGSNNPKLTIVEYSDYQCPACAVYAPVVDEIMKNYGSTTRLVYKDFPLDQHKNGKIASYAAEAAGLQGKYWEMHDELFKTQADWSESETALKTFSEYAANLGLDTKKFAVDVSSDAVKQRVERDITSGKEYRVSYTPTFFLNGKRIENPAGYEAFKTLIDATAK